MATEDGKLVDPEVECLKHKRKINEEHRLSQMAAGDAIERGVLVGELLLNWKTLLPHGQFEAFVESHFDGSLRTARAYMQVTKRLEALPKRQRSAVLNQERSIAGLLGKTETDGGKDAPGKKPQDSPPRSPRNGTDQPGDDIDAEEDDYGQCPNCAGAKWDDEDPEDVTCAKCKHPHGEPAGDVDEDRIKDQRSKTVKTCEALMRAFDDLNMLSEGPAYAAAISQCKSLLNFAKGWK